MPTMTETIEEICEHWRLKGLFDDDRVETKQKEMKSNMLPDGSMVGHFPRWTAVIDKSGYTCTCPDHQYRGSMCKHLGALAKSMKDDWDKEFPKEDDNEDG